MNVGMPYHIIWGWCAAITAGGARTAASWQSVSLISRGTGLCAKDTDTVTHIGMHSHSVVT